MSKTKLKLMIALWWRFIWYANYSIKLRNKAIKCYKKANKLLKKATEREALVVVTYKVTAYENLAKMYSEMADEFDERSEFYRSRFYRISMKIVK